MSAERREPKPYPPMTSQEMTEFKKKIEGLKEIDETMNELKELGVKPKEYELESPFKSTFPVGQKMNKPKVKFDNLTHEEV